MNEHYCLLMFWRPRRPAAPAAMISCRGRHMTLRNAAAALGLSFVPLSEGRFDLVFLRHLLGEARVARLLDAVGGRAFRQELASLGGYVTSKSGEGVAEVRPA